MRQAVALAVLRNGVVGRVADKIRLVVADDETMLLLKERDEAAGQTWIAIVEQRDMPSARHAFEDWRKAMQGDQRRGAAGLPPAFQLGFDTLVIRPKNLADARVFFRVAQVGIAGDRCELADFRDRRRRARRPVAVDHQPRIILLDQHSAERVSQCPADAGDADVPGDMALPFQRSNAEPAETAWDRPSG